MEALYNFIQSIGNALGYLIPTLCFITGSGFLIGAVLGFYRRGKGENGLSTDPLVCFLLFTAGASLLNFGNFLNMGSTTMGLSATASLSNSSGAVMKFSSSDIQTGINNGPLALLIAFLHLFRMYFRCYGALAVYWGVCRQIGRAKGENNTRFGTNITIIFCAFLVMHAEEVTTATLSEMGLLKSSSS